MEQRIGNIMAKVISVARLSTADILDVTASDVRLIETQKRAACPVS